MNCEKIKKNLNTKWLGTKLVCIDETTSTNYYANRLLEEGKLKNGTVIIADRQTDGRGRMGRQWHSEGGLCMTLCAGFDRSVPGEINTVTLAAGVAVVSALRETYGLPFYVKYPNDIIADGKKLGGILAELKGEEKRMVLLGIGLNVSQEAFPEELGDIATSLKMLGVRTEREAVAAALINRMEEIIDLFRSEGFKGILPLWKEANCTLGKKVKVNFPGGMAIEGTARGMDEDGALLVETADGTRRVTSGDIFQ